MSLSRDLFTPTYHASYALVVGIDQYQHLQPLGTAVHGAQAVAGHLRDTLGFTVTELYDTQSNREAILRWFGQLRTDPDDRVIFYFAGHGITQNIKNRSKGFLALANSDGYWNSLAMDEILDESEALQAKHVLYLLDACFSGLALRGRAADFGVSRTLDYLLTRPARYAITAGGDEVVDDDAAGEYSLFTHVLLQAFYDKSLQADGVLRAKEVGLFIEENVSAHRRSRALPNHGYLHGSGDGDFIFAWQTGPRLPGDLEMALRSDMAEVRWGAVAALINVIRDGNAEELAAVARERLETLSHSDPDNRVRTAAQSLFDEEEALRMAEQERIRQAEADVRLEEARRKQEEAMRIARKAERQFAQAQRRAEEGKRLTEAAEQDRQKALNEALHARELTPLPRAHRAKPLEEVVPQDKEKIQEQPESRKGIPVWALALIGILVVVSSVIGIVLLGTKPDGSGSRTSALTPAPQSTLGTTQNAAGVDTVPTAFTVYAQGPWQDTGVTVDLGTTVMLEYVSGNWTVWSGEAPFVSANGLDDADLTNTNPVPSAYSGALIAKVGDGVPVQIGLSRTLQFDTSGTLYLQINDDYLNDNEGKLIVKITVAPTPAPQSTLDVTQSVSEGGASTTTIAPKPTDATIYDDFENPAYEGGLNSAIWEEIWKANVVSDSFARQENGVLVLNDISPEEAGPTARLTKYFNTNLNTPLFFEADLKVDPERHGQGNIIIQISANRSGEEWWYTECRSGDSWAGCGAALNRPGPDDYNTEGRAVNLGEWHKLRIEVDPTAMQFKYYFDGMLLGEYTPAKDVTELRKSNFNLVVKLWTGAEPFTGYADNVRVGSLEP